jgi:hypothetical protein
MKTKRSRQSTGKQPRGRANAPSRRDSPRMRLVHAGSQPKLELRERLQMPREMFSRLVNVSVRALADVESGKKTVAKLERPYNEVGRLFGVLTDVIKAEAIGPWFVTPNDALGGLKPLEIVERGEIDRLWEMAFQLRSGMPG